MDQFFHWLDFAAPEFKDSITNVVDVGGYQGGFTESVLKHTTPATEVIIFEANIRLQKQIAEKFSGQPRVTVIHRAISNTNGPLTLNCGDDPATSSILQYAGNETVEIQEVMGETLDSYLSGQKFQPDLIKIDTQGADLRVLEGAGETLHSFQPMLMVELLFTPLYKDQADFHQIVKFLDNCGYQLIALLEEHYNRNGLLSFADGVFAARSALPPSRDNTLFKRDEHVKNNNELIEFLERTCEERLQLIHRLDSECKKRQEIIDRFEKPG